jgi:hypothetical protein
VGKRAAAIAVLLSLSFLGSLLALALVGERHVVDHPRLGRAASPLPPGVDAPPVQVEVPQLADGSPRPGSGGRPAVTAPPVTPQAEHEPPHPDQARDTPPDAEPPAPAPEPPPVEQPPPLDVGNDDGATHLKTDEQDQDEGKKDKKQKDEGKKDKKQKDEGKKDKKQKDEKGGPEGGKDRGPKDKVKDKGKTQDQGSGDDTADDQGSGKGKDQGSGKGKS